MRNIDLARIEAASLGDIQLFSLIKENLDLLYRPHANALLEIEKQGILLDSINLRELASLPGVSDAFLLDFEHHRAISCNGLAPVDSFLQRLDYSSNGGHPGGRAQLMRRTVGGLTRFKCVSIGGGKYSMLLRHQGSVYPALSKSAVGLILDKEWFVRQAPSLLDSLARENSLILFMAPQPADTQWLPVSDPYRAANNEWKQTLGVLDGNDTLWWYGDPHSVIRRPPFELDEEPSYAVDVEPFDLTVMVKIEFPETAMDLIAGKRIVSWLFPTMAVGLHIILILVFLMTVAYYSQNKRNQIALSHLAHSVKTPVARLKLAADILEGGQVSSPNEEQRVVQTISDECRQLQRAVENAALAMEGGKIVIHKEPGDIAGLIREIAAVWRNAFDQAGIRLVVEGAHQSVKVSFDHDRMRLLLDNLIDNALRHTYLNLKNLAPEQALVTLMLRVEGGRIILSVTDSGPGVEGGAFKSLFKPLSRRGKDPLTGVSGLGLGLSLAKEIIERHGGTIMAENTAGGGARFVVEMTNTND